VAVAACRDDGCAAMSEWISDTPDGREVVVRRKGDFWRVKCGNTEAESRNLDVALTRVLRADPDFLAHTRDVDYPAWIRQQADAIDPKS
jgi:hypothetical protein